jgi:DNA repair exonuclease SbcCD ATPase subunit
MSKVQSLRVKNILGIKDLSVELAGRHVYAVAGNGKNKTSFINAVFRVLTGKEMPGQMLHQGADKGEVHIETDEFNVRYLVTEAQPKGTLTVTDKLGTKYGKPREWLNGRVGVIDMSLQEFFSMSDGKKLQFIRELYGLDLSDLDALYKEKFTARTAANKEAERLKALVSSTPYDAVLGTSPVSFGAVNEELRAAMAKNAQLQQARQRQLDITHQHELLLAEQEELRKAMARNAQALAENKSTQETITAWFANPVNQPVDLDPLNARVAQLDEENKRIQDNVQAKALLDQWHAAIEAARVLDMDVKQLAADRQARIEANPLPVDGLTITDGKLYYQGIPFEYNQVNLAEQYIVLLQLQKPLMREMHIARMDFSVLDDANTLRVLEYAQQNGIQIFGELVDRSGGELTLQIVDETPQEELKPIENA